MYINKTISGVSGVNEIIKRRSGVACSIGGSVAASKHHGERHYQQQRNGIARTAAQTATRRGAAWRVRSLKQSGAA